ncbi:beta-1,3-glucosyltransferase isoform X2 [Cephus cinctus]|nr:beta-1,3-glucosyltransferase isoform X2 [Cephus cinctus]XP_024944155.1 beta-1,3-glucosyltransferase isoform X2 [Cephus cinctus]
MDKGIPNVILTHNLDIKGSWTFVPLLPYMIAQYSQSKWFFFCEDNTVIRLPLLINFLSSLNYTQEQWLGHALYDREPTIIHHFAEHTKKFKYPNVASGFAISAELVHSLANKIVKGEGPNNDFSIDASYEFSSFILSSSKKRLIHAPELCVVSSRDCATYPRYFHPCTNPVPREKVFIAVKTCSKYHLERIPIIKQTWGKYASNIGYFTDKTDKNLPDAYVVPNTEQGHCAKTFAILEIAHKLMQKQSLDWLIITDDDTILGLARLLRLLTCYNPANPVALGERYGFRMWHNAQGYDYLTGGAGLALSASIVQQILESGLCHCPSPSSPDDMFIFGICISRLGVKPTQCSLFHQARPLDYALAYLASNEPVSFHKFWMIDPIKVYEQWFAESDSIYAKNNMHTEL